VSSLLQFSKYATVVSPRNGGAGSGDAKKAQRRSGLINLVNQFWDVFVLC
jgi:hypothetical protein